MPPAPIAERMSYGPRRLPGARATWGVRNYTSGDGRQGLPSTGPSVCIESASKPYVIPMTSMVGASSLHLHLKRDFRALQKRRTLYEDAVPIVNDHGDLCGWSDDRRSTSRRMARARR